MTLFIQKSEEEDTGRVVYEVFRRTSKPRDQTIDVVDSKQQAIALAGRVAEPGESIEEFAQQTDFDFIARGPGAEQATPEPESSDTGGGVIDFLQDGIEFLADPDRNNGGPKEETEGRGGGAQSIEFFAEPEGGESEDSGSSNDPMAAIESFEEDVFGGEDK